jgi:hypothetical protein
LQEKKKEKNPMRARALHKNSSRHGLSIQRFLIESPLLLAGSSCAAIQRRKTSMSFIPSLSKEIADLGNGASLVFLLVSSCLVPLILGVFSLLWIAWFGYNLWPLFWITFSLEFWYRFHVWDPGGKHGGLTALMFQDGDLIAGGALLKINPSQIWFFDLGQFNFLYKNKHDQLCKFRLWFYFLFSWVLLELDWIYWSQ